MEIPCDTLKSYTKKYFELQKKQSELNQTLKDAGIISGADFVEWVCEKYSKNECVVSVDVKEPGLTYEELNKVSNKYAYYFKETMGLKERQCVGLLMKNRPSFLVCWIALAKIGVTIACLNTNLPDLTHHVTISDCSCVIYEKEFKASIEKCGKAIFDWVSFDVSQMGDSNPPRSWRSTITPEDPLFYIFTSGTTGNSKAALFNHKRFYGAGVTWSIQMNLQETDSYYISLPLYHGNGGVVAVAACIIRGCRMVLRRKFSVRNFWPDIRLFNCTAMIYIGELWQYLFNQKKNMNDHQNPLRVIAGNGLRESIWQPVKDRFGIELIVEHYGQTEMISAHPMINCYNVPGSCGFIPIELWEGQDEDVLIEYDVEKDMVVRDKSGFCQRAPTGKVGECISILKDGIYNGYTSKADSEKKIYRNVFNKGDAWFHSGDLLRVDKYGFFYFVDRIGDTFRWKGENVSTQEVTHVLSMYSGLDEINVYGIEVPNYNGKCGMASIVCKSSFDIHDLSDFVRNCNLPEYAKPKFLRILEENEKTSTMKFKKFKYSQQALNSKDPIFVWENDQYVNLTPEKLQALHNNELKL